MSKLQADSIIGQPASKDETARKKKVANGYDGVLLGRINKARYEII